jgi:hypothetical protein
LDQLVDAEGQATHTLQAGGGVREQFGGVRAVFELEAERSTAADAGGTPAAATLW